jgi:hypothetical protein
VDVNSDEAHHGTASNRAMGIVWAIDPKYHVLLSGTPYRQLLEPKWNDGNTFSFSYIQEQELRQKDIDNNIAKFGSAWHKDGALDRKYDPSINVLAINLENKLSKAKDSFGANFSMSELFQVSADGESFVHQRLVELFVASLHDKSSVMPYSHNFRLDGVSISQIAVEHTLWMLTLVKQCLLLKKVIDKDSFFKKHYDVVVIAGECGSRKPAEIALQTIADSKRNGRGSIILSCGKLTHGITVPSWHSVIMLNDGRSAERYVQTAFRAQSKDVDAEKMDCYVFDFSPIRTIDVLVSQCSAEAINRPNAGCLTSIIEKHISLMPLFCADSNTFQRVSVDKVMEEFGKQSMDRLIDSDELLLEDEDIEDVLIDIELAKTSSAEINDQTSDDPSVNDGDEPKNQKGDSEDVNESSDKQGDRSAEELREEAEKKKALIREALKHFLVLAYYDKTGSNDPIKIIEATNASVCFDLFSIRKDSLKRIFLKQKENNPEFYRNVVSAIVNFRLQDKMEQTKIDEYLSLTG